MNATVKLLALQIVSLFVGFALILFVLAGTIDWLAGWTFLVLFFGFVIGLSVWLHRNNPGLLQERTRLTTPDQQGWDKVLFPLLCFLLLGWLMLMPLDAVRWHWSHVPGWLHVVGIALLLYSFYLHFLAFRANSYLSPVVRVQEERGHTVISSGPYHYVRHPMYAAIVVLVVGTPLLLGSWYGLVVGILLMSLLARRAVLEERMLQHDLRGYTAYMSEVRYRLIPYLW